MHAVAHGPQQQCRRSGLFAAPRLSGPDGDVLVFRIDIADGLVCLLAQLHNHLHTVHLLGDIVDGHDHLGAVAKDPARLQGEDHAAIPVVKLDVHHLVVAPLGTQTGLLQEGEEGEDRLVLALFARHKLQLWIDADDGRQTLGIRPRVSGKHHPLLVDEELLPSGGFGEVQDGQHRPECEI